jgi:hypothetical protein
MEYKCLNLLNGRNLLISRITVKFLGIIDVIPYDFIHQYDKIGRDL